MVQQAKTLISRLTYDKPIAAFDDYRYVRSLKIDKFLVTTGFIRMQTSKVKWLDIQKVFRQIHIIPHIIEKVS
ncbi:hypothetical protein GCM10023149_33130 [Mucilaginibacter gynuensis]|uniref:Uncharacterized protein n=1 Tax=Mucilaginibacter gynuensis TaxID=1302236 RepID=A0ABP8GRU7_9SPHI